MTFEIHWFWKRSPSRSFSCHGLVFIEYLPPRRGQKRSWEATLDTWNSCPKIQHSCVALRKECLRGGVHWKVSLDFPFILSSHFSISLSGKTLCYVIAILETLLQRETPKDKGVIEAIVILPTRFVFIFWYWTYFYLPTFLIQIRLIAKQVQEVFSKFIPAFSGRIETFLATGGTSKTSDISARCAEFLSNHPAHIVLISTPGCLTQFLRVCPFVPVFRQ